MHLLLAAGVQAIHTAVPVQVTNFPTPAPSDKVATDTLFYARWTFWATVIVGVVTVAGVVVALVDLWLNMRQFQKSQLIVTLSPDIPGMHFTPGSYNPGRGFEQPLQAQFALEIKNVGQKAAEGCYVTIYIPKPLTFEWLDPPWTRFTMMESVPPENQSHRKIETFIREPIYVGHPIPLPVFNVQTAKGELTFEIRWQVNSVEGKNPKVPGCIKTGIRFGELERAEILEAASKPQR